MYKIGITVSTMAFVMVSILTTVPCIGIVIRHDRLDKLYVELGKRYPSTAYFHLKDKIGMGYYARQQHELMLIGNRGQYPTPESGDRPSSVIRAVRTRHSAKPVAAYEAIERMYPPTARTHCELFARSPRPGWTCWGHEAYGITTP